MTAARPLTLDDALAHRAFVRRLARGLLADRHAADDVEQATWQAVLERPPARVHNLRGWLRATVTNLARMHLRAERRRRPREAAAAEPAAESTAEAAARLDELGHLLAALHSLPEAHRAVVMLRYYDDLPPRHIAARLRLPLETVKSRLQRALARLRHTLDAAARGQGKARGWQALVLPLAAAPARSAALARGLAAAAVFALGAVVVRALLGADAVPPTPAVAAPTVGVAGEALPRSVADDSAARTVHPAPAPAVVDEQADAGPSYLLHLVGLPRDLDGGLSARLAAADPRQEFETAFAPLDGDPPRARFGPEAAHLRGGPPYRLEVRSGDGFWLGGAEVASTGGEHPYPVRVELHHCGAVRGLMAQPDGDPVGQARVTVRAVDGDGARTTVTDGAGRYALPWLPPGVYSLLATSPCHRDWTARVVVQAGSTHIVHGELVALPGMAVHGRLLGRGGGFAGTVYVVLSERGGERAFTARVAVDADSDGGEIGTFDFAIVPQATYEATVHTDTFHRWSPDRGVVGDGRSELEFTVADDVAAHTLVLRATDAATGAAIPSFAAFARLDGADHPATTKVRRSREASVELTGVPDDARLEWVLRADGYVPVRGDRLAFAGGGELTVPLQPGWGNRFRAVDRDGAPIAGVTVLVDDMDVGSTGADGSLDAALPQRPRLLRAVKPGLAVAGGDVFADGTFDDLIWGVTLVLEPRDR